VSGRLEPADEGIHEVGVALNWNESRYVDFWDPVQQLGGWFRIGNRPNEGHAEMSACVYLPDGRAAFQFGRPTITENGLSAAGQRWEVLAPFESNRISYAGEMFLLEDPWALTNPKQAFSESPRTEVELSLLAESTGVETVLGQELDQVHLIFLPGQADHHYQHLAHVTGTVRVGDQRYEVDGRGGKDHSWGPRNWHAKIYLRWLVAGVDDDNGFMLTRAVGPTTQTRSGFVLHEGQFHIVDSFSMRNRYAEGPHFELLGTEVELQAAALRWTATGTPRSWLPLRHRQTNPEGTQATLRIVKSPMEWILGDGRTATGSCEYHDLMEAGRPVGLHE
jgi:hypothetical protein